MPSIAEVIDFLMSLMRDDTARREFAHDPAAALTDRGLADLTGQDVRDARLMMADNGAVHARPGRPAHTAADDPVREIHYTTSHFEVGDVTTTVISVQDNDTLILDSFDTDVTAIQDNDVTDVDVISIVDGEEEKKGPEGNEEDAPNAEAGSEPEVLTGGEADPGAVVGVAPGPDEDLAPGFEDFGAGEGFAPEEDSGFGVRQGLGTEAGPTSGDDLDELVG